MSTTEVTAKSRLGIAMELDALQKQMRAYVVETHPSITDQLSLSLTLKMLSKDETFLQFLTWMSEKEKERGTESNSASL